MRFKQRGAALGAVSSGQHSGSRIECRPRIESRVKSSAQLRAEYLRTPRPDRNVCRGLRKRPRREPGCNGTASRPDDNRYTAAALDDSGAPRRNTEVTRVVAREVRYVNNDWTEISDTRLMPSQTAAIELPWNGAKAIRVWLEVIPDHYYATQVFPALLQDAPLDRPATTFIAKAAAIAAASPYRLFETELRRP
jgi:hypothetical protein